jgi:hypothetical protein
MQQGLDLAADNGSAPITTRFATLPFPQWDIRP